MSIFNPTTTIQHDGFGPTVHQLKPLLNPDSAATLDYLLHALIAPEDTPRLPDAIQSACDAVASYGVTLKQPSAAFRLVKESIDKLHDDVSMIIGTVHEHDELERPLIRRLAPHAPYALCLTLAALSDDDVGVAREAAGVEIALALATAQCCHEEFATAVRRSLTPELFDIRKDASKRTPDWQKTYLKTRVRAAKLFEVGGAPDPQATECARLFDLGAFHEVSRKTRFSPPRQRQAILDRRHQTDWQIKSSAAALMARAMLYDHTALLTLIAFCAGLTLRLSKDLTLAGQVVDDTWFMVLDLEVGVIKTNLDPLFPKAAQLPTGADCFRPANKIAVKPLPLFLWNLLKVLHAAHPEAKTLAQLLTDAATSGRQLTLAAGDSAMTPTTKRFLIAAAPLSVILGIDRLSAAILANDFSVVPSSKGYYCLARRAEIWAASEVLFDALGWGMPAPLIDGLPFGSRIVPTRQAISAWWLWMTDAVSALAPGRRCSLKSLIAFHNCFARVCASLAVLCLAAREVCELKFTTYNLHPEAEYSNFMDKRVGIFPGEVKVPINELLRMQLRLWLAHCRVLRRRLENFPSADSRRLMHMLDGFLGGECYSLFFEIKHGCKGTTPLGSDDLINWWPEEYRFSGDFGRHFFEVELRDAKVRSSRIDLLLRHLTQGTQAHCSTYGDRLADIAAEINHVQESLLESLGIKPVPGLVSCL